jgi:ubiquinone/menaquinone biosynthesis C-methylase UbiE
VSQENDSEFRADQCWKTQAGEKWVACERQLDVQLGPLGRALMERLEPRPGERCLDIGCGSGQTLLELAERVGPSGHVLGVDVSEAMLERARARAREAGLAQVDVELGDAQTQPFTAPFDLEFSRFGVMFFQDSEAAFRHLAGALRPGGRLGFVCYQAREKNEWAEVLLQAVSRALGASELPALYREDRPGPFHFADRARLEGLLTRAGFVDVTIEPEERRVHLGGSTTLDEALEYTLQVGPAARMIADAPREQHAACRAAVREALAPFVGPEGVWLGSAHYYVVGRRP